MVPQIAEVRFPSRHRTLAQLSPLATDADRGGFASASRSSTRLDLASAIESQGVTEVHPDDPEFFRKVAGDAALIGDRTAVSSVGKQHQNGATTNVPYLAVAAWLARDIPAPDFL